MDSSSAQAAVDSGKMETTSLASAVTCMPHVPMVSCMTTGLAQLDLCGITRRRAARDPLLAVSVDFDTEYIPIEVTSTCGLNYCR